MTDSSRLRDPVLTIAGILAILMVARYAQSIVVPLLLSLFIAVIMAVPVGWLKNRGLPVPVSVGVVLVVTVLIEIVVALVLGGTISRFNEVLPGYQARLNEIADGIGGWLLSKGINLSDAGILDVMDPKLALGFANMLMRGIGEVLSNALLITFTVLFMLLEAWSFPAKLNAMKNIRGGTVMAGIANVIDSMKHYIAVKATTSLATGLLVGAGLALVGLDFYALWGFLAFVLNFIPNIGSILAAVPAVLLSLLQLTPMDSLIVVAMYFAINTLIGSIVEPGIMGRRVGLSTLAVFMSLVFWGWLLGPVGMLLSVPLTMVIKFAAQASEQTQWLAVLLSPASAFPEKEDT
jgi:predicted PurR-regulated permease PerM